MSALFLVITYFLGLHSNKDHQALYANICAIVLGVVVMLIADAYYAYYIYPVADSSYVTVAFGAKSIYMLFKSFVIFMWVDYVGRLITPGNKFKRKFRPVFRTFFFINSGLLFFNIFTPMVFCISDMGSFKMMPTGMSIFAAVNCARVAVVLALVIYRRKYIRFGAYCTLLMFQFPIIIGEFIHFMNSGISPGVSYAISGIMLLHVYERYHSYSEMERIIDDALENNSFQVFYQPIYSVAEQRFTACEALLRLYDEERGFISPREIIDKAEESGQIGDISNYLFREVCRFMATEEFKGLGIRQVNVNFSVLQMAERDLAGHIIGMLDEYGISAQQLCAEITETTESSLKKEIIGNMKMLDSMGMNFALDDYGQGTSNLYRIAMMPFKVVKFDRFLVQRRKDPRVMVIIEASLEMCRRLGIDVIVEGVESKEDYESFVSYCAGYIQGYYFSKALPKESFTAFIKSSRSENPKSDVESFKKAQISAD